MHNKRVKWQEFTLAIILKREIINKNYLENEIINKNYSSGLNILLGLPSEDSEELSDSSSAPEAESDPFAS